MYFSSRLTQEEAMRDQWRRHPLYGDVLRFCQAFIEGAWCRETASPDCQADWSDLNPSRGQCAVTALCLEKNLREDYEIQIKIVRTIVPGFGAHYWIRMPDGTNVDMTRDQFPAETVIPDAFRDSVEVAKLLEGESAEIDCTRQRFDLLDKLATVSIQRIVFEPLMKALSQAISGTLNKPLNTPE
jgi:hypothetical protein